MQNILAAHAPILQEIQIMIGQKHKIKPEKIRPVNISIVDEGTMTFQLSFDHPNTNPVTEISLNFEIKESYPHMLFFETLTGIKGYEKANEYHGLENEIIKYISIKTDE